MRSCHLIITSFFQIYTFFRILSLFLVRFWVASSERYMLLAGISSFIHRLNGKIIDRSRGGEILKAVNSNKEKIISEWREWVSGYKERNSFLIFLYIRGMTQQAKNIVKIFPQLTPAELWLIIEAAQFQIRQQTINTLSVTDNELMLILDRRYKEILSGKAKLIPGDVFDTELDKVDE